MCFPPSPHRIYLIEFPRFFCRCLEILQVCLHRAQLSIPRFCLPRVRRCRRRFQISGATKPKQGEIEIEIEIEIIPFLVFLSDAFGSQVSYRHIPPVYKYQCLSVCVCVSVWVCYFLFGSVIDWTGWSCMAVEFLCDSFRTLTHTHIYIYVYLFIAILIAITLFHLFV